MDFRMDCCFPAAFNDFITAKKEKIPLKLGILTVIWAIYLVAVLGGNSNNQTSVAELNKSISKGLNEIGESNPATIEAEDSTLEIRKIEAASQTPEVIQEETPQAASEQTAKEAASIQAAEEASRQAAEAASRQAAEEASKQAAEAASRQAAEEAAAAAAKAKEIRITSDMVFRRNEDATVTIQAQPNTSYSISIYYNSGPSKAAGLESKTSDANGNVSWTWKIGGKTAPGMYRITITGGGEEKHLLESFR